MPSTFMRQAIDALLPQGAVWRPAHSGDYDHLLDGVAQNQQDALDDLESLAAVRDPYNCPAALLPDLEREFGISPDASLTEKERRSSLAAVRYRRRALATAQKLQRALDMAGFGAGGHGLVVTPNSPISDPTFIVDSAHAMTAHDFPSVFCAGNARAYCGYGGGYWLASGDHYVSRPVYPQAGQICARAFDGSDWRSGRGCAGYYEESALTAESAKLRTPPEAYWPLIFFVGGSVIRNPDNKIASVAVADIPSARRQELHRLVLRTAPLGTWAAMMVRYV